MRIPTIFEYYQTKKAEQLTKQQTSLLSAILELHESLQNFNKPQPPQSTTMQKSLELRVTELQTENTALKAEIAELLRELEAANQRDETGYSELQREAQYQADRFKTLQQHYKNSTEHNKLLQDKLVALETQMQNTKPKDYKSWEDAAMTERLQHNQTKMRLKKATDQAAALQLKVAKFEELAQQLKAVV